MAETTDMTRLTTFQHHIDDMRNLVMCKICLKPLYEPYMLACGHTYCYSCLRSWFSGLDSRKAKKNCPDCRAEVIFMPSPNYVLRDLVHMFISRAELLSEEDTLNEHVDGKAAEAELLAKDKEERGLFQGVFKDPSNPWAQFQPLHDLEDGVLRCPHCHWEIEDGMCNHCGYELDEDELMGFSDEDDDESVTNDDQSNLSDDRSSTSAYDSEHGPPPTHRIRQFLGADFPNLGAEFYSEGEYGTPVAYYDDDDDEDLDGFIDDHYEDEPDEADSDGIPTGPPHNPHRWRNPRPTPRYQISDDEDDSQTDDTNDIDDPETQETGEAFLRSMPNWRYGGHSGIVDNSGSEGNNDTEAGDNATVYDESDEDSVRSPTPLAVPVPSRRRPIIISSEDEEDEEEEEEDESSAVQPQNESTEVEDVQSSSSDSDDTTVPPQPSNNRRSRLENHRKRRQTPENWRAVVRGRRTGLADRRESSRTTAVR